MVTKVKYIADGVVNASQITLTTASTGDNTTAPATTAFVQQEMAALVDSSPGTLDTLNELAAALGDDPNFATTTATAIGLKAPLASPNFTGTVNISASQAVLTIASSSTSSGNEGELLLSHAGHNSFEIKGGSDLAFSSDGGVNERVRITNAGNVGIGTTSPAAKLHVSGSFGSQFRLQETAGTYFDIASGGRFDLKNAAGTTIVSIAQSGSPVGTQLNLDSAGNLGLGVTPSAWLSGYKVFEMPQLSLFSGGGGGGFLLGNAYLNSSAQFIYKVSGLAAASYNNQGGSHVFSIAPSGTAGSAISFTQAMTLDNAGNVGIGTSSPSAKLTVALPSGTNGDIINMARSGGAYDFNLGVDENSAWYLSNASDEKLLNVTYTGKVGIGISSPTQKLEVAGTALVENAKLKAIAASNSDTAVDVFIYDTRKDSDGGAWRKRTQNTSWYNETLNTSTRGARKEFPCVAVIVAENGSGGGVSIYDGDDPDLPLWMKFSNSTSGWNTGLIPLGGGTTHITAASAKNGQLSVSTTTNSLGLLVISFIEDMTRAYLNVNSYGGIDTAPLSLRNTTGHTFANNQAGGNTLPLLVNLNINDVAMTVLPNAPIDADTGLPVPTIAVATNGGVSVIKDDGTVINFTGATNYDVTNKIIFTSDHRLRFTMDSGNDRFFRTFNLPSATVAVNQWDGSYDDGITGYLNYGSSGDIWMGGYITAMTENDVANVTGLIRFEENVTTPRASLAAYISSTYNTGYVIGHNMLATLSDTDTTNAVGTELVTNGTFDSDVSGWSANNGATIVWNGSGDQTATVTSNGVNVWNGATQTLTGLVVGKTYILTADIITSSNWGSISFSAGANSGLKYGTYTSWNGGSAFPMKAVAQFTASATSVTVSIDSLNTTIATVTKVDNISVRLAEQDRSYYGKGLQVFGTITKTAVATGADLVGYSGFSANNYLLQPYNSDLNFGTGDFSISAWVQLPTVGSPTRGIICEREGTDYSWQFFQYNSRFYFYVGSSSAPAYTSQAYSSYGIWYNVVVGVKNGKIFIYVNGEYNIEVAGTPTTVTATDAVLSVGVQTNATSEPFTGGQIALLRISATAPSAEQIAKIYNDEKFLFQENAKATLYGSSDAVTALAYDDDTELLHVGTSAGRSVFQGLNRVDNTTDAVGTAISASNGLVAED